VLGVLWIGLGLVALLALRALPEHGRLAAFTVLIAVWAGDTFAFFVGRFVGRHKLAPTISPAKTWEGFVGGTAATIFATDSIAGGDATDVPPNLKTSGLLSARTWRRRSHPRVSRTRWPGHRRPDRSRRAVRPYRTPG